MIIETMSWDFFCQYIIIFTLWFSDDDLMDVSVIGKTKSVFEKHKENILKK